MRLAFDSRPTTDPRGVGQYSRCLLQALRDTAGEQDEILEAHRPRGAEVFHTPWMQGAMLHSPCPMVVTLHDLTALKRPSERLRGGGMHLRLRHLAVQRATHVIVPCEVIAGEAVAELGLDHERVIVIPKAPDLAGPDLPGSDLEGSSLTGHDLARPDLAAPDLAGSGIAGSDLAGPDLTAADPTEVTAGQPAITQPAWTWEDAARETWAVYRRALAQPHRPCVASPKRRPLSMRRVVRAQPGRSSAEL
jgi:hypothetical protein